MFKKKYVVIVSEHNLNVTFLQNLKDLEKQLDIRVGYIAVRDIDGIVFGADNV